MPQLFEGRMFLRRRLGRWSKALCSEVMLTIHKQVIVNGQVDGVGHNSRDLQVLITKGNAFSTAQTMEILYMIHGGGITVSGLGNEHGVVSVIRYDDRDHDSSITHGENNGRKLRHSHIVKDITYVGPVGGWAAGAGLSRVTLYRPCREVVRRLQYWSMQVQEAQSLERLA